VVDLPKDLQFARGLYSSPHNVHHKTYNTQLDDDTMLIREAVKMMAAAKRPIFYTGGGVINSGPVASTLLRELVPAEAGDGARPDPDAAALAAAETLAAGFGHRRAPSI